MTQTTAQKRSVAKWNQIRRDERETFYAKGHVLNFVDKVNGGKFDPNRRIELVNYISFEIPYDTGLSKNKLFFGKNVYRSPAYKAAQEQIEWLLKNKRPVFTDRNKVWLDVFVEKSDLRSDAINLVDGICDGVKKAIGVDDRWFSIRRVDWRVVKNDPKIFIGIGQEVPQFYCPNCGRFVPNIKKQTVRSCIDCYHYASGGPLLVPEHMRDKRKKGVKRAWWLATNS